MAAADTARLIASLELQNRMGPGVQSALKDVGKLETRLGNIGKHVQSGLKSAGANIAKVGVVAGAGLAFAVKSGLEDLAKLENATTAVDGAIEQMGLTGQVTSKQVAQWANDIERDIGAAFDDKDITAAAATLLRFGKVTPDNLQPALEVMTDLAVKTGSVESAAALLAKALADPEKAAGKLARTGIVLTKSQQDIIKAMVEAGDVAGAQAFILDRLEESTKGAAAASQGPYKRAMSILADVSEDAKKALAEGFLPVIEKVANVLSEKLADPKVIADIRGLGQSLAGALDKAFEVATKIPWESVGDAMRLAGQGAKAALNFFTSLPPWVQTAVLTGWGLNKLTGGAVSGIIGEIGKGLIKGVLGMNAGVVNARAGVVNVAGAGALGATGAAAGAGKATSALGLISKVFMVGAAAVTFAAIVSELKGIRDEQSKANQKQAAELGVQSVKFSGEATLAEMQKALAGIEADQERLTNGLTPEAIAYQLNIDGVRDAVENSAAVLKAAIEKEITKQRASTILAGTATVQAQDRSDARAAGRDATTKAAVDNVWRAVDSTKAAVNLVRSATEAARSATVQAGIKSVRAQENSDAKRASQAAAGKAAIDGVMRSVNQARSAIDTVRAATNAVKTATDGTRDAVGAARAAIKALKLRVSVTTNVSQAAYTYLNGRQLSAELDRSTTVVHGTSSGQTIS